VDSVSASAKRHPQAGGIGVNHESSMNTLAWPQVTLILLVILLAVVMSEWVSAKVRHAII
jgi:phosphonate transport system permease protein